MTTTLGLKGIKDKGSTCLLRYIESICEVILVISNVLYAFTYSCRYIYLKTKDNNNNSILYLYYLMIQCDCYSKHTPGTNEPIDLRP